MTRTPLPERRAHWTQKVHIEGQGFYLCVGEYPDGRPGEIWLEAHKLGTFARGILDALARMTSVALQCEAPLVEVIKALKGMNFPPNETIQSENSSVTSVTSIADWIAQELEFVYLNKPKEKVAGFESESWRIGA